MRTIGVVTVSRSDYGIYRPLLRKIREDRDLRLHLIVTGMHLSAEFGWTVGEIEADGFEVGERVEMLLSSDTPEGIGKSIGLGVIGFAQAYARFRPDLLVISGDRFEMYAAALAALAFKLPLAHIHGGELTQGAIDDALRHSMTKLSHLHFVSTEDYARRVRQLGEEPWRVVTSGALSLDSIAETPLLTLEEFQARYGIRVEQPFLLVTYHPVTLESERTGWHISELLAALGACGLPVLFTAPNADTSGRVISHGIEEFLASHSSSRLVASLGAQGYLSAMALAAAMVGNSSSGIVEALPVKLSAVNVGTRQHGRVRSANIIDVGYRREEILQGIQKALSPSFRASFERERSPFGDGRAAERILDVLRGVPIDDRLLVKRFCDWDSRLVRADGATGSVDAVKRDRLE